MNYTYLSKGEKLLLLERYKEALKCFEEAIIAQPRNSDYYLGKAFSLEGLRQYDQALDTFKKALELSPDEAHILMCLGGIYLDIFHNYDQAIFYLDKVISKNPPFIHDAYVFKGMALKYLRKNDQAKTNLELALGLKLKQDDYRGHFHRARAFSMLGRKREAKEALKKALKGNKVHYRLENASKDPLLTEIVSSNDF